MKKSELDEKLEAVMSETAEALQAVFDALNQGQQKKILKNEKIKKIFDRYGVEYRNEE